MESWRERGRRERRKKEEVGKRGTGRGGGERELNTFDN